MNDLIIRNSDIQFIQSRDEMRGDLIFGMELRGHRKELRISRIEWQCMFNMGTIRDHVSKKIEEFRNEVLMRRIQSGMPLPLYNPGVYDPGGSPGIQFQNPRYPRRFSKEGKDTSSLVMIYKGPKEDGEILERDTVIDIVEDMKNESEDGKLN